MTDGFSDLIEEMEQFREQNDENLKEIEEVNRSGFEGLEELLGSIFGSSGGDGSSGSSSGIGDVGGSSGSSPGSGNGGSSDGDGSSDGNGGSSGFGSSSGSGNGGDCEGIPLTMSNLFSECDEPSFSSASSVDYGLSTTGDEPDFTEIEGNVVASTVGNMLENSLRISLPDGCPSMAYNPCEYFGSSCQIDICDSRWKISGYHVLEIIGFMIQMIGVLLWWRIVIRGFD